MAVRAPVPEEMEIERGERDRHGSDRELPVQTRSDDDAVRQGRDEVCSGHERRSGVHLRKHDTEPSLQVAQLKTRGISVVPRPRSGAGMAPRTADRSP